MKPIKVFETIGRRRIIVLGMVFVLVAGSLSWFGWNKLTKRTKAAITQNGNAISISGTGNWDPYNRDNVYLVDNSGRILTPPAKLFRNNGDTGNLDFRYYSYLFEDSGYKVDSTTDLDIWGGAYVMMEGTQSLNSLHISNGYVTQPYPDRSGNINNKPLYTNNFWGMSLTGFLAIPAHTFLMLTSVGWVADDGISYEIGNGDTIDASTVWSYVYSQRTGSYDNTTWPQKNINWGQYIADGPSVGLLTNTTGAVKYVPIRIKVGEKMGNTSLDMFVYTCDDALNHTGPDIRLQKTSLYGVGADNRVSLAKIHTMNFEYYVSQANAGPNRDWSNAIRTTWRNDIDLTSAFSGMYGEATPSANMHYDWNYTQSPLGKSWQDNLQTGRGVFMPYREASRYSAFPYNTRLVDTTILRRIPGGLTLNVTGTIDLDLGGSINLTGTGYPGYAAEIDSAAYDADLGGLITPAGPGDETTTNYVSHVRGGSVDNNQLPWHGKPGGGYSNTRCNGGTGGGGSHAGAGGYLSPTRVGDGGIHCQIEARPSTYGNQYNPNTMGSGAGAGADSAVTPNIAGSGGGLLKINTSELIIRRGSYIYANGSDGEYVDWHTQAGGAGGTVNIITNTLTLDTNQASISASGSSGWLFGFNPNPPGDWHVGGGGGYIYLEYNSSNQSKDRLLNNTYLSVAGGNGGWETDRLTLGDPEIDGEPGIIQLSSCPSCGCRKKLVAVERSSITPVNNFNPYALQLGDVIRVEIEVNQVAPGGVMHDYLLKVPGKTLTCKPNGITSVGGVTGSDTNGDYMEWTIIGSPSSYWYQCKVQK